MRRTPPENLALLHDRMMKAVLRVLGAAARARLLRTDDPVLAARLLARLAVPLLEQCEERSPDGALFVDSMTGLLLRQGSARSQSRARSPKPRR